jgi:hypothetical protein
VTVRQKRAETLNNIATIQRQVYSPHSTERGAALISARYVGEGLRREEYLCFEGFSDWTTHRSRRVSDDNGRTWSEWQLLRSTWPTQRGFTKREEARAWCFDPRSGLCIDFVFQRILPGVGDNPMEDYLGRADHSFWCVSEDEGETWGPLRQFRYEKGAEYDSGSWSRRDFYEHNRTFGSYSAIATRDGSVIYPCSEIPMEIVDDGGPETVDGIICFIGAWDSTEEDYSWERSQPICVPHRISARGLLEPCVAELSDGRLWLVMRGSNRTFIGDSWSGEVDNPGRKWMSLSDDGGRTWSPVTDLRYDTGEQFCSPSAFAKVLRHSDTGRLYWFGNICPEPSIGNRPRVPLYLAEVDESIPALKRDTLTVIDDRDPTTDTDMVQLSNFQVFENRESAEIELYLTRYAERPSHRTHADAYRYTITLTDR